MLALRDCGDSLCVFHPEPFVSRFYHGANLYSLEAKIGTKQIVYKYVYNVCHAFCSYWIISNRRRHPLQEAMPQRMWIWLVLDFGFAKSTSVEA